MKPKGVYTFDDIERTACSRFLRRTIKAIWHGIHPSKPECCEYYKSALEGEISLESAKDYVEIHSWAEFYTFARQRAFPVYRWQYERYSKDPSVYFVALADERTVYSYGWVTTLNRTYVGAHDIPAMPILFDFETPPEHRRKGYYTQLLKILRSKIGGIIYARPDNLPSLTAIRKAGFTRYS